MMNSRRPSSQAGISLIEALVALAIVAFGMLGMVGMQATLRSNSDVSKQRAEAVRIGQGAIEKWRAFERLESGAGADFAEINTGAAVTVTGDNATFTVTATATPAGATVPADTPQFKTVTAGVSWTDRAGQQHAVSLVSTITAIAPALAGALGLPNDRAATERPRGRNSVIPASAANQGSGGTSVFTPPGGGGTTWVFNNTTGFITSVCVPANPCVDTGHFLLSGFVRFATGAAPTPAEGEMPIDPLISVGVVVDLTSPSSISVSCFTENVGSDAVAYYCALPVTVTAPSSWSGQSRVTGLSIATSMSDATASRHKVCRYTPVAGCHPAVGDLIWGTGGTTASCTGAAPTPNRKMTNAEHALNYASVTGSLTQQNFLVISAGDGSAAYTCPGDDTSTPFVNGNTYQHQPAS